jgi:hypothetical protein
MTVASIPIDLRYETDDNSLELDDFLDAMDGLRELAAAGAKLYNVPLDHVHPRINAPRAGSLHVVIDLHLQAPDVAGTLLTLTGPELLGAAKSVGKYIIEVLKIRVGFGDQELQRMKLELEREQVDHIDRTVTLNDAEGKPVASVRTETWHSVMRGPGAIEQARRIIAPAGHEGVDGGTFSAPGTDEPPLQVEHERARELRTASTSALSVPEGVPEPTEREVTKTLTVIRPGLRLGMDWTVEDDASDYKVRMGDMEFMDRVLRRDVVFGAGDELDVRMTVRKSYGPSGRAVYDRVIDEVIDERVRPRPSGTLDV